MQKPLAIAIISGLIVQMPLVLLIMPLAFAVWSRKVPEREDILSFDTRMRRPAE